MAPLMRMSLRAKTNIIYSFERLLMTKDFRKITIANILEEAKVSKGTFYKYFQDKYDLAKQAYDMIFRELKQVISANENYDRDAMCHFLNKNRMAFECLMKISDDIISIPELLKEDLKKYYLESKGGTDVEADLFSSQVIWSVNYLSSLNKTIRNEDVRSVESTAEKFSIRLA